MDTVDDLKRKLAMMRSAIEENHGHVMDDEDNGRINKEGFFDGAMVSVVFGVALAVIVGASFYAFRHLYIAVQRKFPDTFNF